MKTKPKYCTISVFREDWELIKGITEKKPDTNIADTVKEIVMGVSANSYLIVLEGEENITTVSQALNKYLLDNKIDHKVSPVDESEFIAMLAGIYLTGIKPELPKNPEGGEMFPKKD